jgi:hypothetical protein
MQYMTQFFAILKSDFISFLQIKLQLANRKYNTVELSFSDNQ